MTAFGLTLILLNQTATDPAIELTKRSFKITVGGQSEFIPLEKIRPKSFSIRENENWFVWDERGLTVRTKAETRSTKFPDIVTSPKLFTGDEILETARKLDDGTRERAAAGLSGYALIGDRMYFLVRWEEKGGKPWLEALVELNTRDEHPWPKFVAKMPGVSQAKGAVSSQLLVIEDRLVCGVSSPKGWGIASVDLKGKLNYKKLGENATDFRFDPTFTRAVYVEKTEYGSYISGWASVNGGKKSEIAESRAAMRVVSVDPPMVAEAGDQVASLRRLDSGVLWRYPAGSEVRVGKLGILAWNPAAKPTRAALLDMSLRPIARWTAPNSSEPIKGEVRR